MARYWLNNISNTTTCPYDHHPLKLIRYQRTGMAQTDALTCDFCGNIYLQYISAEIAASQPDISDNYLSGKEKQRLKTEQRKAAEEKARARAEQEKKERERLRKIREEQERVKREREERLRKAREEQERMEREQEAKRRAEQAALKAKKDRLIALVSSVFETDYFSAESVYKQNNTEQLLSSTEFSLLQAEFTKKWFSEHAREGSFPPDKDQGSAISATKKNIEVVARAGSGKTATIINRFRFLAEHCNVEPSTVIMLAFNKKAAGELREKINALYSSYDERERKMPHIMTFHALAYSIVHPEETLIYDDEEAGARTLSRAVQEIIDEKVRDDSWSTKIREVMLLHFKGNWEAIETGGHNLSEQQQLVYRRSIPNKTLNNEYVKSHGEKVIANILFEHDIEYTYEKYYKWDDGTPYRPDFTVYTTEKKPVIIEYFGMAGDSDYDQQIARKENFCAAHNLPLIGVSPSDVTGESDTLTKKLLQRLTDEGITYRELTEDEIWERIKDRAIDEFTKAITSFIGRCRKKDLSVDALSELVESYTSELPTEGLFLELACNIYGDYLKKLERDNLEDFDGLMSRAVQSILQGKTSFDKRNNRGDLRDLTFIMIDEYQDFSFLFDRFLTTIRTVCPQASIFCVGDDWQAINAFAGSDVRYFQDFTWRYEESDRYSLKTNYRSKKEIVSIATRLMTQQGSPDSIYAAKPGNGTVRIGYLSDYEPSPVEKIIHDYDRFTPAVLRLVANILDQDKNVVFLTRANDRLPLPFISRTKASGTSTERFVASIRTFFPQKKRLTEDNEERITISTTHKYKGKENDAVIVLDAITGFYPLIHPAWIFQRVFGDTIEKLIEEERRLFYVALSRAKEDLFILTMKGEESPFLSALGKPIPLVWDDYSPVKTDEVSIRVEVCNQRGNYVTPPTMLIKEWLKADDYKWDAGRKRWYHFYSRNDFDISEVLEQEWTHAADHVYLIQYDENDQIEDAYLFADGNITQLEVKGKSTE